MEEKEKADQAALDAKQREALQNAGRIESLRERLYSRGEAPIRRKRHPLVEEKRVPQQPVSAPLKKPLEREAPKASPVRESIGGIHPKVQHAGVPQETRESRDQEMQTASTSKKRSGYRIKVMLAGLIFFVAALGLSSMFLFFGNNTISGENISIDIADPPLAVGGGEEMTLNISIANQNTVPIESATLIINYPPGTQSTAEPRRELFTERQQLGGIGSGEAVNVPIEAVFFGEENEEKVVNVSVEYRVRGSNATFYKEAEPWRFRITSSPVTLSVDSVRSISSGQELTFELTVRSNSPTPLRDILVKASYPQEFDFTTSEPSPDSGQDTWVIEELGPEGSETIEIKGIVVGRENEERIFDFSTGVAAERDRFNLASVYTRTTAEIAIEDPFLGVDVLVNNSAGDPVTIGIGDSASVRINFENTLDDTIYDGTIIAKLSGSALSEVDVDVVNGFYDSSSNTLTWDFVDTTELKELAPGRTSSVSFNLQPERSVERTPEIKLDVTAKGQRVFEDRVPQELVGTASRVIRIASAVSLSSSALYSEGPFVNTGPVPPVAEQVTQYAYLLSVRNGSNEITDAQVTAVLPRYVSWLDLVTPGDDITYNTVSRTMTWDIGNMDANEYEEAWIQISFLPSLSQVDTTPTLLETQRFRATDRFTGTVLRSEAPALTTALIDDPDMGTHDGRVQDAN